MDGRRVLVTGASGFIGRLLARRLLESGAQVTGFAYPLPRDSELSDLSDGVDLVEVDLRFAASVKRAVAQAQPDVVFHLAAAGVTDPFLSIQAALRVNLDGTINLLRAVRGEARVVVARTPGERDSVNVYSASKAAAWEFCRMFARTEGWPVVGAMIFQCYGPGQPPRNVLPAALAAAREGRDFPMSPGEQVRDWIYVQDVVAGLTQIAEADLEPAASVDLGTGVGTPLRAVVESLFALVDAPGRPRPGALPYRPGEVMRVVADARRTAELIGWQAEVALDEGLRRYVGSYTVDR